MYLRAVEGSLRGYSYSGVIIQPRTQKINKIASLRYMLPQSCQVQEIPFIWVGQMN